MDDLKVVEMSLLGGTPILPWDRFNSWLYGLCVVTFDLELGQAIEKLYPPEQTGLSESDKTNICYLAFPDSNSGVMGDTQFHFRIRLSSNAKSTGHFASNKIHTEYNRKCPASIAFDQQYLFGFVYFRQVKDASIRRGYYQKSVILLTKLPLVNLFPQVSTCSGEMTFCFDWVMTRHDSAPLRSGAERCRDAPSPIQNKIQNSCF